MKSRPSNKELINKLKAIQRLIKSGSGSRRVLKPIAFQAQLRSLDLTTDELWGAVLEVISEINPVENYQGGRPPQKSYEDDIKEAELWAYSWKSAKFQGREVYLKFAIQNDMVWLVSFHYSADKKIF